MGKKATPEITMKDLIMSFSLFGFAALICIFIWKRQQTVPFLSEIFDLSNILISSLIGIGSGIVFAVLVAILARVTKTKMPDNEGGTMLLELMKKPYGPVLVGVLPGVFEELFFRGFLLALLLTFMNTPLAILLSTLVFWLLHVPQYKGSIVLNVVVFVLSIGLSILFVELGTLWAPILAHGIYNYLVTLFVQKGIIEI
ncbi:CPBP family intramembrane metalloprotease [Aquibacillus koreensis]|uniref:CPBP family intramembrane metalloprotease n=1 Tax=Aquibacillus koreensis TaxID=279446 RepID=A0A9X3WM36_9BACI|nr:CPBP family intramembrane glutamic endopeptidase [Aquibacillus koreensis]MCT2535432.1 CPBP family intramembrane metalloprotease [Aquibacillus koreensis]MDC3422267.1 CPBP family intramembrane metalloprotease [Aquibacillus koreensis]